MVSVVVVAFNSADVIESALHSLPRGVETIVVDNASTDDSLERARAAGARCIRNEENLGFSRASNIGAAAATRDFVLFFNPDATLTPGSLERMLDAALRHPDAGAVGPMLVNEGGESVWRCASVLHPLSPSARKLPVEPEGLCCFPLLTGAALLCRKAALEDVGGFDDKIFLYHDDDDISVRLRRAGWSLLYEPAAVVYHAVGKSTPPSLELSRFKAYHRLISRIYVLRKYGLHIDLAREWRRALRRLAIAILLFDTRRRAAALGMLAGLAELQKEGKAGNASVPHDQFEPLALDRIDPSELAGQPAAFHSRPTQFIRASGTSRKI